MSEWNIETVQDPQPLYATRRLPHGVICLFADGPARWTAHLTARAGYDAENQKTAQHLAVVGLLAHLRLVVADLEALAETEVSDEN